MGVSNAKNGRVEAPPLGLLSSVVIRAWHIT